jgi:hypothetical protein
VPPAEKGISRSDRRGVDPGQAEPADEQWYGQSGDQECPEYNADGPGDEKTLPKATTARSSRSLIFTPSVTTKIAVAVVKQDIIPR